ncbi:hypothetical protein EDC01DRAFT_724382 [Geopyxis carbonaria]|nr:hypothetical protein EDC01DRAFT_724382 [Geopyxis carbonaria]
MKLFGTDSPSLAAVAAVLATLPTASAFFRMPCSGPMLRERSDPIVNPGAVSPHLHTIFGGNGFNFTMGAGATKKSTCSSCKAKADMSNYWAPDLWIQAKNGSVHPVDHSGALVYYLQRKDKDTDKLYAFPEGFRMLAGTPTLRTLDKTSKAQKAVSYACLGSNKAETPAIPNYKCPDGLRAQIFFPSCWNGQLDSKDHKSHLAYPSGTDSGKCPSTHPKRLVSIFIEVLYSISEWDAEWKSSSKHPFVLSNGDATGYGYHADFVNGWDVPTLQKAIDTCTADSGVIEDCAVLKLYTNDETSNCVIPPRVAESTSGWLPALPGCNAITGVGATVTPPATCKAVSVIGAPKSYATDVSSRGWKYVGCASDSLDARVLPKDRMADDAMTVEMCVDHCKAKGWSYAGLQWATECWCGSALDTKTLGSNKCTTPCAGASKEYCGGDRKLSVYKTATAKRRRSLHHRRRAGLV